MAGIASRNIWAFVVPSVIVIFSLFWFRKKRKIKDCTELPSTSIKKPESNATSNKNIKSLNSDCKTADILISELSETVPLDFSDVKQCMFISSNMDGVVKPWRIAEEKELETSSADMITKPPLPVYVDDNVDDLQDFISKINFSETVGDISNIEFKKVETHKSNHIFIDSENVHEISPDLLNKDSRSEDVNVLCDTDKFKNELVVLANDLSSLNIEQPHMFVNVNTSENSNISTRTEESDWKQFTQSDRVESNSDIAELIDFKSGIFGENMIEPKQGEQCSSIQNTEYRIPEEVAPVCNKNVKVRSLTDVCENKNEISAYVLKEIDESVNIQNLTNHSGSEICSLEGEVYIEKVHNEVVEICAPNEKVHNGNVEGFNMNGSVPGRNVEMQSSSDETQSWSDEVQSLSDEVHSSSEDVLTSCDEVPCSNNRFQCGNHALTKHEDAENLEILKDESEINVQMNQLHSPQSTSTLEENGILNSPLSTASVSDLSPFSPTVTVEEEPMSLISADASSCANDEVDELRSQDESTSNINDTTLLHNENEQLLNQDLHKLPVLSEGATASKTSEILLASPIEPVLTFDASGEPASVELECSDEKKSSSPPHTINISDILSESSVDSEKGNETATVSIAKCPEGVPDYCVYEFELPQELCGRLIGKHGKHVKYIKERSNANVFIKRHPYNPQLKLAVVEGTQSDVNNALELIRKKYPPSQYAHVTLAQTNVLNSLGFHLPESLQLHLPENVSCNVILSSLVTAGHFFLQQPTHHTYPSLSTLDQCMMACYTQLETPQLPQPVEAGVICAATIMNGWFRAQVVYVYESGEECDVKFVDYGGFSQISISSLRQIRSDFMSLPFQASECYLANVKPISEELGWSPSASATFEELAQGQILHALVVDYTEDGIPYVHLYRVQGVSSTFINQELVDRGFAIWFEHH